MKKYFVFLLAFVLILTGCNSKYEKSSISAEEALNKSTEYMNNVKNYKMSMEFNMGLKVEENGNSMETDLKTKVDLTYDLESKNAFMELKLAAMGNESKQEAYISYSDDAMITYYKEDDNWVKISTPFDISKLETQNTDLLNEIKSSYKIEEIDADKDNYNYEVTIGKEGFSKILSIMPNDNMSDLNGTIDMIDGQFKFKLSLNKETFAVSKIYMDLSNLINVSGIKFNKYDIVMEFKDYNKGKEVVIPEDALNAKELEQEVTPIE